MLSHTWSWLCNINNNNNNKVYLENFQKGLQVLEEEVWVSVWRAFTPLTISQVHNEPQVIPKKSGFPLNNTRRCLRFHDQWFYWLMKSLCSSDSVEKKKHENDEQSGRHIQSQIPQQSQCKGPRKQFLSRIVLAQSPCHIAFKAFRSILTIAMYRCTIITLLLYFNFEVLILSQLAATMHPLWVEFKYTVRGKGIITCNRDWWEGVWGVWGVWGRSNLPQKSST